MARQKQSGRGDFEDTQSIAIDFADFLTADMSSSGSFYVNEVETSSLGKLLQAFPIPALLIDSTHHIIFANQACVRLSPAYEKILGAPLSSLCPHPDTALEIQFLVEQVFSRRKPRVHQGLLGADENRMWGRIHFRSLRMIEQKLVLLLIEDLTLEKKQLIVSQRHRDELVKEITERKRAERALRESETLLRSILSTSPVGIGLSEHRIMNWANEAWMEMFGFENEQEFVGQSARIIYPSDAEFERVGKALYKSLQTGQVTSVDAILRRKDGTLFDAHLRMKAVGTSDMDKATVAAISNISKRKRAEQSLRESEERFRAVVEDQTELICRLSADKRFKFVNAAFCRYFDLRFEELIGKSLVDVIPEEWGQGIEGRLTSLGRENPVSACEIQISNSPKGPRWLKWVGRALFDTLDEFVGYQFVGRDITDQKRAEEALRQSEKRFRAIFEGAEDYIFLKDRSFRYTDVNPAGERLLGLPASQVVGLTSKDLFSEEDAAYLREVDTRVLGGETIQEEHTVKINGMPLTFLEIRIPLRDDTGEIVGIFTMARDITDRKRTEITPEPTKEYRSKAMQVTLRSALLAAKKNATILLTGESGSGKDYLAQYIHAHSDRAGGPFFSVNCAAIAPQLAESELFGHEKGAFTGAVSRKRGLLELAEGGTLLLNEIGELTLPLQAKLLTFLDSRKFTRVGGEKEITVNARLIVATNRDLGKEVAAKRFRQDLFYRINVMSIEVPPLRDRPEDIPTLVREIIARLRKELQIQESPIITSSALQALKQYGWPGNVRELRNVLERSLILSHGKELNLAGLGLHDTEDSPHQGEKASFAVSFPEGRSLNEITHDLKRFLVKEALRRSRGSRQGAAHLLGISRYSLKHYMKKLGYDED
jgi:PAS domain S-box-containing protein